MWEDLEYADENGMPEGRRKKLEALRDKEFKQMAQKEKYPDCEDKNWWCNNFVEKGSGLSSNWALIV